MYVHLQTHFANADCIFMSSELLEPPSTFIYNSVSGVKRSRYIATFLRFYNSNLCKSLAFT
jgi:hypothetical protein